MKTAELIRNDNVYRAIGGECWLATYEVVGTEVDGVTQMRLIRPKVLKVEVVRPSGSMHGVMVARTNGDRRYFSAGRFDLFDDRDQAQARATAICEERDGTELMNRIKYRFKRPKPAKVEIEYRIVIVSASEGTHAIEYRDPASRRWKPVYGLFLLTRWKANDCLKRLRRGDEIPGYWRVGESMEFIELADNVE